LVATTDVSILYPLPGPGQSLNFIRASEVGNHGMLLSAADFSTLVEGRGGLESVNRDPPSDYPTLALIGLRLDPCAKRTPSACTSEVRVVFQAVTNTAKGASALDGGVHVTYDLPKDELADMAAEILFLKKANGDLALQELAPHPILSAEGLGGPFATGLRSIVLFHLGENRIARATSFDHNMDPDSDGWTFRSFERRAGALTARAIPFVGNGASNQQMVAGSSATSSNLVYESHAFMFTSSDPDNVQAILGAERTEVGMTPDMQRAFAAALRVENPEVHTAETTSCGNCHLAEGASRVGKGYRLSAPGEFTHARSLARIDERTSVTNLHAFGYLGRQVSIMQRTANESALVADQVESLVKAR
jgi:hypothetical protein